MRPILFLVTAALAAAPSPALLAQSKKTLWKPPVAVATNVSVGRGDRVGITLRGFQGNNPIAYEIARTPRHGRLSTIVQPDPNRVSSSTDGSVVYVHDNSDDSTADEFTFRVRAARGGGVSAPATVRITVMDLPPVLAAPASLDFAAAAGETMTRTLGLTNAGGGVLQIDARAKPPFEIPGAEFIELPRGASTNVLVRYAPASADQAVSETIRPGLNDATGAKIVLHGESVAPFDVVPLGREFTLDEKARVSSVTLVSRATEPQEVAITSDPEGLVGVPSSVRLAPGASVPVELRIPAGNKSGRREVKVAFATPFHRRDVALVAPPVPADLDLLTREMDFTDGRRQAVISVTNAGGVAGSFRLSPAPGLAFAAGGSLDAREFTVAPDSRTDVEIVFDAPGETGPPAELPVALGGETARITIIAPPPVPQPSPVATTTHAGTIPPPREAGPWGLNRDVRLADQGGGVWSLEWRTSLGGWQDPRLEVFLGERWSPYARPEAPRGLMERIGDFISAFFGTLVAGRDLSSADAETPSVAEWTSETIDGEAAANGALIWRLTAREGEAGGRETVSEAFVMNRETMKLQKWPEPDRSGLPPAPAAATTLPAAGPSPVLAARRVTRALEVESARADPRRNSATVQVVFTRDPEANGYRLEHGFNPTLQNPATGVPYAGEFRPATHPSAQATVAGTAETEHEGRKLTVLTATIEGLNPGTSTRWRVVTMSDGKDRWPTDEFLVSTLPPWRFPWRPALFIAAFAALAAVLYLRWRANRAPQ